MDLSPFKQDIDELIEEFSEKNATTLDEMKKIWRSRKFSFIFEAKPSSNVAFFMQALYSQAIFHFVAEGTLSRRLGGLYCLYCLSEVQPFTPAIKIYFFLEELKKLRSLVRDAKQSGVGVALVIVKRMLSKNVLLFGFVHKNYGSVSEKSSEQTKLQDTRMKVAYQKLFSGSRLSEYLNLDLDAALQLDELNKLSQEYTDAKMSAIEEAGKMVQIDDISHIVDQNHSAGDEVGRIANDWEMQKEQLYLQTGTTMANDNVEGDDAYEDELVRLLEG